MLCLHTEPHQTAQGWITIQPKVITTHIQAKEVQLIPIDTSYGLDKRKN